QLSRLPVGELSMSIGGATSCSGRIDWQRTLANQHTEPGKTSKALPPARRGPGVAIRRMRRDVAGVRGSTSPVVPGTGSLAIAGQSDRVRVPSPEPALAATLLKCTVPRSGSRVGAQLVWMQCSGAETIHSADAARCP